MEERKAEKFSDRHKKLIGGILFAVFIIFMLTISYFIGKPILKFVSEPEKFREWVDVHGIWGRLAYIGMMALQVFVAFIPGEPFEIGGGYAFGAFEGTIACLIGASIGSILVFLAVRRFGVKFAEIYFPVEKINSLKFLRDLKKRDTLLFILFALPGTPKDLLCYFAGLTDIGFTEWLVICSLGRLPSIITSTVGGNALGNKDYLGAAFIFGVTLAVSAVGLVIYRAVCERRQKKKDAEQKSKNS